MANNNLSFVHPGIILWEEFLKPLKITKYRFAIGTVAWNMMSEAIGRGGGEIENG